MKHLLALGADPKVMDMSERSPLDAAIAFGQRAAAEVLLPGHTSPFTTSDLVE